MCESFGARLRQRREDSQISLSTIAEQTKIKLSLLEGLERDDVSRWPSGIFRRAFIRAYAHAIGLQPDVVVREFLDTYPDPLEEVTVEALAEATAEAALANAGPPTRLRYLVGAAVGSLSRFRSGSGYKRSETLEVRKAPAVPEVFEVPEVLEAPDLPEFAPVETAAPEVMEATLTVDTHELYQASTTIESSVGFEQLSEADDAPPAKVFEPDLSAAARLCTELSRVDDPRDLAPLLEEVARVVDAVGLIVWVWDPQSGALTPALPHGYSDEVLAQLPNLPRDARNATAAAFRSAQTCTVSGGDAASDALVVPLLTGSGCAGVLAIELQHGAARRESVQALATIFAAQLANVVRVVQPTAAANRRLA